MKKVSVDRTLLRVTHSIGKKIPTWTQGFGGNVSLKNEKSMWIKSSGFRLDSVSESTGISTLNLQSCLARLNTLFFEVERSGLNDQHEILYSQILTEECLSDAKLSRPSMETAFHAVLPRRYVLHFHSLASVLMAHEFKVHPGKLLSWLESHWDMKNNSGIVFYPSLTPGLDLAIHIRRNPTAAVHIIANHGIIIQSDSPSLLDQWESLEKDFAKDWGFKVLFELLSFSNPIQAMGQNSEKWESLEIPLKIYYPDTAVFLNELQQILEHSNQREGFYKLPKQKWSAQPNLTELWLATLILYRSCPQLQELDPRLVSTISRLPLEELRKRKLAVEGPTDSHVRARDCTNHPIQLIIPMSGQGTRYQKHGYTVPKPLIPVSGTPMIQRLLNRFPLEWPCHFVLAENHRDTELPQLLRSLRPSCTLTFIPPHHQGPGLAVLAALRTISEESRVLVSYCDYDMIWDPHHFERFVDQTDCDACVISYRGFHPHYLGSDKYAYSQLDGEIVTEIKEKGSFTDHREEEFASSGGYYFKTAKILKESLSYQKQRQLVVNGELYTSLTVQALIEMQRQTGTRANVRIFEIPVFFQWGTPMDLRNFEYWERIYEKYHKCILRKSTVSQVMIPMAGAGSRFHHITSTPKALIPIDGKPMFQAALNSLPHAKDKTVLVTLNEIAGEISKRLPHDSFEMVTFKKTLSGQALSVEKGLSALEPTKEVLISSCDHGIVLDPDIWESFHQAPDCDAAIFTIKGFQGTIRHPEAYAYVSAVPGDSSTTPLVKCVSVKKTISNDPSQDHLLVGTFWFKTVDLLASAISKLKTRDIRVNGELYLDSVFEILIEMGQKVRIIPLEGYLCWGEPNALAEALYWHEVFCAKKIEPRNPFPGIT